LGPDYVIDFINNLDCVFDCILIDNGVRIGINVCVIVNVSICVRISVVLVLLFPFLTGFVGGVGISFAILY